MSHPTLPTSISWQMKQSLNEECRGAALKGERGLNRAVFPSLCNHYNHMGRLLKILISRPYAWSLILLVWEETQELWFSALAEHWSPLGSFKNY